MRLTHVSDRDALPVFSPDGTKVMWTGNRDDRSPTRFYIADFNPPTDE